MSRKYEQRKTTERRCVELKCDMCGAVATNALSQDWGVMEYTTCSTTRTAVGLTTSRAVDVCYICMLSIVHIIEREPHLLRKLIGREASDGN